MIPRSAACAISLALGFSACEAKLELPNSVDEPCLDTGRDSGPSDSGLQSALLVPVPEESRQAIRENGSALVWIELERSQPLGQQEAMQTDQNTPVGRRMEQLARTAARETRAEELEGVLQAFFGRLPPASRLDSRYRHLNMVALEVTSEEDLDILARDPQVVGMWQDQAISLHLDASLDLIGQPEAYDLGYRGAGTAVAVLDTGLDYTRSAFGTCSAPGVPGCKVAYVADFALEDGMRDSGSHHGTNVAAIVGGVAPETALLGLDVFGAGGTASISDIFSAFDWVLNNQATYNIVAVNMSLGSGAYPSTCTGSYWDSPTQELLDAGILPVASSGNSAMVDRIGGPACAPAVASVGAVYKQDYGTVHWSGCTDSSAIAGSVTCFSNSANFLDLLAPGAIIDAAGISMGGTSQAAPHVAGAVAVIAEAYPDDGPSDWLERLHTTGLLVEDPRNGVQTPLIDLPAALAEAEACAASLSAVSGTTAGPGENRLMLNITVAEGCDWRVNRSQSWLTLLPSSGTGSTTIEAHFPSNSGGQREVEVYSGPANLVLTQDENDVPSGTLSIASGNPFLNSRDLMLDITAEDDSGVESMCVNLGTGCTWIPFADSFALRLPNVQGTHTARARFRDIYGVVSDWTTLDLTLDNGAPMGGSMELTPSESGLLVEWGGFTDRLSPISTYHLAISSDGDPAVCGGADHVWSGSSDHHELVGLTNGVPLAVRLCATDAAGNQAGIDGFTLIGEPSGESNPVQVNAGATWTRSKAVRLSFSPPSGTPSRVCISNSTSCTAWRSYASSFGWNLLAGQGQRSVFVWFSDADGVVSGPFWDPIIVDNVRPLHSSFSVVEEDEALSLAWSISDSNSGIERIEVYGSPGTRAPNCGVGTLLATTTADAVRLEDLTNGQTWGIRVCATDHAGNRSRGSTLTVTPRSEHNPPTGSLQIAGGAETTSSRTVDLNLSATDDTGLSQMCISNSTSCTAWQAWTPSISWNLTSGYGTKRVRLWLRDLNGNVAGPLLDTIEFAP